MRRGPMLAAACAVAWGTLAAADSEILTVVASQEPADFFQLESSGRKNIAADNQRVGLVWEETRGGRSASYLAFRSLADGQGFDEPLTLGNHNAFNPVIASCGGHFYVAWIEEDSVRVSTYRGDRRGPMAKLAHTPVNELTIGCRGDRALLAWSKRAGRGYAVEASSVGVNGDALDEGRTVALAPVEKYRFQTNPGVAYADGRVVITWHDRTSGTNLLYASSGTALEKLDKQVQINELIKKSYEWGSGSSAVRNALAVVDGERLVAIWLDKRASRSGYKVYSAFSHDGGVTWGDNYNIIDEWGLIVPQWTPTVAAHGDGATVVWMDARESRNILWSAELNGITWSDNDALVQDGEELQSPVVAYSPDGTLHLAWIEKHDGGNRIRYLSRRP